MLQLRTLKFLAGLLLLYAVLATAGLWGPQFMQPMASALFLVPFLSVYLFHKLGVPGLLEHGGQCGWGWCSPTLLGWALLLVFWLGIAWLAAWGLAALTRPK
jgi:hypothetical protein